MKKNKGISLISLVVAIVLIIILAAITAPMLSSIIDDSLEQDARTELKNVQSVVENAKTLIMTDQFMPKSSYIITDTELMNSFGMILSMEEINHIKAVNADTTQKAPYKYYLMDKNSFQDEFGNEINVSGIRDNREYLVNYMEGLAISSYNKKLLTTRPDNPIVAPAELARGEVYVSFYPEGNTEWKKQQATEVTIRLGEGTILHSARYVWTESTTELSVSSYNNLIPNVVTNGGSSGSSSTHSIELTDETGNGWYLWVLVEYEDVGMTKTKSFRSDAFYIDNTAPSASFEVDEIRRSNT